jgi:hypothetical protein
MIVTVIALFGIATTIVLGFAVHHHHAAAEMFPQPALAETSAALSPLFEPERIEGDPFAA